jgi:hypothetical protein
MWNGLCSIYLMCYCNPNGQKLIQRSNCLIKTENFDYMYALCEWWIGTTFESFK